MNLKKSSYRLGFLKLPNLNMLLKQKSPSLPWNDSQDFWQIANSVLNKGKSASVKAKLLAKNFSKNSNLDDSGTSYPVFPPRTNLKLHNISVTPKTVKKIIMNLNSSKASGPVGIPVVVLKTCETELIFHIVGRFYWWSLYLRMLGKGLQLKLPPC